MGVFVNQRTQKSSIDAVAETNHHWSKIHQNPIIQPYDGLSENVSSDEADEEISNGKLVI